MSILVRSASRRARTRSSFDTLLTARDPRRGLDDEGRAIGGFRRPDAPPGIVRHDAGILTKDFEPGAKDVGAGGLAEQFVTALETRRTRITRFSAWNSTTDYQESVFICHTERPVRRRINIIRYRRVAPPRIGEFLSAPFFCFGPLRRRTLASDCGQFLRGQVRRPRPTSFVPAGPATERAERDRGGILPSVVAGISVDWERMGCRPGATWRTGRSARRA
jgi:hypothetical protein